MSKSAVPVADTQQPVALNVITFAGNPELAALAFCRAALASAFFGGRLVRFLSSPGAALLAAAARLVDGCPGPALGLPFAGAAGFVTLFDVFSLPLLLRAVFRFGSSWHMIPPPKTTFEICSLDL